MLTPSVPYPKIVLLYFQIIKISVRIINGKISDQKRMVKSINFEKTFGVEKLEDLFRFGASIIRPVSINGFTFCCIMASCTTVAPLTTLNSINKTSKHQYFCLL